MISLGPIFLIIGTLLTILAAAMLLPAGIDYYVGNPDWVNFLVSAFFTGFIGGILIFTNQGKAATITLKQTFILTTLAWIVVVVFAALPLSLADIDLTYTDAFFEAMSGVTTTGSTVIVGLDQAPPGILLWRALLQGLGGMGIIVFAIAILPMLKIGGMQLFRAESSDRSENVLPRARQLSTGISVVYILLTLLCSFALWLAGMDWFDAICHAMPIISTGGFANYDASIGHFNSISIEMIASVFMILGALPFALYIQMVRGKPLAPFQDSQVRWFLAIVCFSIVVLALWTHLTQHMSFGLALRHTSFNIISIITTTGLVSTDYNQWGSFAVLYFFFFTVMGGCTGSTSGGIKVFRHQVLFETAKVQIMRLIQPHGVFRPFFNGKPIEETTISSVLSFFILFAFIFLVFSLLLGFTGLDFITSMSGVAQAMANTGPGLGNIIGPAGNFSSLSDAAKWILSAAMLVGRLELFTVLVLFSPYFWKS